MSDSYGVVVGKSSAGFGIWPLFRDPEEAKEISVPYQSCDEPLRLGDIVQARDSIHRCQPCDAVWSEGKRIMVRTIVSYVRQITIENGKFTENDTGHGFVILSSSELGYIAAPVQWYNREFSDANECHLLAFVEFGSRMCTNALTFEPSEFCWTVVEDRCAFPVVPSKNMDGDRFREADKIYKVPALTLKREGNHIILWSYALNKCVAIIASSEWFSDVGQWTMVTVIPSPPRDMNSHRCTYTVIEHDLTLPVNPPEIDTEDGRLLIKQKLRRNDLKSDVGLNLWHEYWGLPIEYDDKNIDWIRIMESEFEGIIEVVLCDDKKYDERRVMLRAINPATVIRMSAPNLYDYPPIVLPSFDNMSTLKTALGEVTKLKTTQSDGVEPTDDPKQEKSRPSSARSDWKETVKGNNNNNNNDAWCPSQNPTQTTTSGLWQKKPSADEKTYDEGWYDKEKTIEDKKTTIQAANERATGVTTPSPTGWNASRPESRASGWNASRSESRASCTSPAMESSASISSRTGGVKKKDLTGVDWTSWGTEETKEQEKEIGPDGKKVEKSGVWTEDNGWNDVRSTTSSRGGGGGARGGGGGGYGRHSSRGPYGPQNGPEGRGWGAPSPSAQPAQVGFGPISTSPSDEKDKYKEANKVPKRAFEDKETEQKWKEEMEKQGWVFPYVPKPIVIPDGEDGWDQGIPFVCVGLTPPVPPMPVEVLINKRSIVRDAMRCKRLQCLITKVRFDFEWKNCDRIQLYVLDGTPAYIVYELNQCSYIKNRKEYTTVGHVVELNVIRTARGYVVNDEMWRLVTKLKMPIRERVFEDGRVRILQVISNAKCLMQEAQDRHNDRWRYNQKGFIILTDEILQNMVYYGKKINVKESEDVHYQVLVEPDELLKGHTFWEVKEVLYRVVNEIFDTFEPVRTEPPTIQERVYWPPPKPQPPVDVRFSESFNPHDVYDGCKPGHTITYPRETRMEELFALYERLMENANLMKALYTGTGMNYEKKFKDAMEVGKSAMPHQKSMKRELQVNADFLITIIENVYTEGIFKSVGERKLWKHLVKITDSIKAFRSTVNNR